MCNYYKKNVNVKTNYRKIGKKKDNDVDTDVTQLERSIQERSNNKCYALSQSRVITNTKIYQLNAKMQEKLKKNKK